MYLMIWRENGHDRWERFSTMEEVRQEIHAYEKRTGIVADEDIWIYTPEADNYVITGDMAR